MSPEKQHCSSLKCDGFAYKDACFCTKITLNQAVHLGSLFATINVLGVISKYQYIRYYTKLVTLGGGVILNTIHEARAGI